MPEQQKEDWAMNAAAEIDAGIELFLAKHGFMRSTDERLAQRMLAKIIREHAAELEREAKELRQEITELYADAFFEIASEKDGWFCTNGRSTAVGYGERLVELAGWENSGDGVGRVQYYRPKPSKPKGSGA